MFSPPGDPYRGKRDLPAVSGDHCFSIHIMADDIKEETETFTVRLYTSEKHGVILYPAIVEIAIIDNDGMCVVIKHASRCSHFYRCFGCLQTNKGFNNGRNEFYHLHKLLWNV